MALPEYVTLTASPDGTVVTVTGRAEPLYVWLSPPSVTVAVVGGADSPHDITLARHLADAGHHVRLEALGARGWHVVPVPVYRTVPVTSVDSRVSGSWPDYDVFVVTAVGTYRYDIRHHALNVVTTADIRALAGKQDFVATAPVSLVYVADYARMPDLTAEQQLVYGSTDVGFSVQNAYLYCASAGLATVVRGSVDREALGRALGLGPQQRIILAQCVGWPAAAA